ncbi:bifunctional 4-hydroxy-2-oxoglutarate aldolase/2-dehydro-3-deoxy-phosphogluconate aldolase [Parapedobacter sp. ISTM3]|uniref:2-dehydro-3-deoxyphosphogluconate aldolase / (4S)-4-hydroxy-2-oxoglutarate aldolase n=1 Tax=Parapedobacter luteus TaxID=623280 RepID=A0A1T5AFP3_9SPHI|nr:MULTISPECIES: bifunctional 4-hydroxy-2-oxoglutarate aldolase/2-dehydro-3-deoxy-phosphogluconate aldolase [Parapedobacter]MBK1441858.1 bifunctional 4-hydroxy-2-oxoglutarate aldolase/2-dehydro-3-deoxy-phosphogluconate aldolase [Parapedobacter sp. ISTM3]SKB33794.1 2-dehydro-3-deoxyphosphogluconate aldolase / (4S)-4-hydroxy-2-oxoglutarate aldolase [Parapedobacter luteus]
MSTLSEIKENGIIAIIRGLRPEYVLDVAEALYAGGIRIIEVTMNSEEPLAAIRQLANTIGDRMVIGAGTVLDTPTVEATVAAGARFILSPVVDADVIQATKRLGAVSIPGAFTPTEIYAAYKRGADIVKVFPAMSPAYIRSIGGPLPHIPLLPSGGITPQNIRDFKDAGAVAFGVGNTLINTGQPVTTAYFEQLTDKARQFVSALAG